MEKLIGGVFIGLMALVGIVAMAVVIALPVMWLWDYLCPDLFGFGDISFKQALALSLLCSLLFKGSSSNND